MSLSVILISYNAGQLQPCLESLVGQLEANEIIVADCSTDDPTVTLARKFPGVRFVHFQEKRSVPELRWAGFRESRGDLVATLEARSVPASDWCAVLVRTHGANPDAPAVGGPVALAAPGSPRDEGLYFCEYGQFAPPVTPGPARELSGANLSYRRAALEQSADLLDAGRWETLLHQRWRNEGRVLVLSTATVFFKNAMPTATAVRQRFAYGRGYAAARLEGQSLLRRFAYAAFCPVLPWLLTARLGLALGAKGLRTRFWRALPWILVFNVCWAAGEMVGYLLGDSGKVENY
jgi:glycosyltransferase involved in cell wall biosynthesis